MVIVILIFYICSRYIIFMHNLLRSEIIMAKIVECSVCGKGFAVTDEEFEKTETNFICKYCKKMIKVD